MSDHWVQDCKRILDQTKNLEDVKGDRLDMVRKIRFTLHALQRSVSGWTEWINNPDVMAGFSLQDLKTISKNLAKLTQPFIEYDCETTSHAQRDLITKGSETQREPTKKPRDRTEIFYVK